MGACTPAAAQLFNAGTTVTFTTGGNPEEMATADLDGDGHLDLVVPSGQVVFSSGLRPLGSANLHGNVAVSGTFTLRPGAGVISAAYLGSGSLFGSISAPRPFFVAATPAAVINGITDITGDQGGRVRLQFNASPFDRVGSTAPIVRYDLLRRISLQPASRPPSPNGIVRPAVWSRGQKPQEIAEALTSGWDFLFSIPVNSELVYGVVAPTLADSNTAGNHLSTFLVRACTATDGLYYDSSPDSGSSVDNPPPAPPEGFNGYYQNGGNHLHWHENTEADLWYYRLYRGGSSDFMPGPQNLIANLSDTSHVDPGAGEFYYKLPAVDVNYNDCRYSTLSPLDPGSVDLRAGPGLTLAGAVPDPPPGSALFIAFALPSAAPAELELLDVAGRWKLTSNLSDLRRLLYLNSVSGRATLFFPLSSS